jgi:hypothetical protein
MELEKWDAGRTKLPRVTISSLFVRSKYLFALSEFGGKAPKSVKMRADL